MVRPPVGQTPLTALRLGELFMEAGMPAGVVNIVTGFGDAGAALAAHPQVDKIAFTGSTEVGRDIVRAAADTLKKVTLELGGKSPNVVFADADLDAAIAGATAGIFFNTGQSCSAGSRLYVESRVFEAVVEGVADQAKKIRVGSGLDPKSAMGPLISREQFDRVSGYVQDGLEAGAHVSTGGRRLGEQGFFMEPTILTGVTSEMKVVQEEIFGPVVTAVPFDDPAEVVPAANDTIYGLAAGIWTRDISKAHRLACRLNSKQARCGSIPTRSSTLHCRSVDTSSLAGGVKWATRRWRTTSKRNPCASTSGTNRQHGRVVGTASHLCRAPGRFTPVRIGSSRSSTQAITRLRHRAGAGH